MPDSQGATDSDTLDSNRTTNSDSFARRHLGVGEQDAAEMAADIGFDSLDRLVDTAMPENIRISTIDELPDPVSESEMLKELEQIAAKNSVKRSLIGLGYSNTITPPPILRNILENPGWYTQYTPYQAEISQGRMETLFNFQTMVSDLTGLEISNASLLDEGTAAAEAVSMAYGLRGRGSKNAVIVSSKCHPQTIEVIETRARPLSIDVKIVDTSKPIDFCKAFAIILQYPDTLGIPICDTLGIRIRQGHIG